MLYSYGTVYEYILSILMVTLCGFKAILHNNEIRCQQIKSMQYMMVNRVLDNIVTTFTLFFSIDRVYTQI